MMHSTRVLYPHARLLLAEDNPLNRIAVARLFARYGCQLVQANNGDDVVRLYQTQPFDLVLMDCQMPGMDGYDATREIRRLEQEQGREPTPIIAFSASLRQEEKARCLEAGMDDFLLKPVDQDMLEALLARWLKPPMSGNQPQAFFQQVPQTVAPAPAAADPYDNALDAFTFRQFRDLMEDDLGEVLQQYLISSRTYLSALDSHLASADFVMAERAVHPLKSSARQIGALRLSQIAESISRGCLSDQPDMDALCRQSFRLHEAAREVERAITPWLAVPENRSNKQNLH